MTQNADLRQRTIRSLGWQLLGAGGQRVVQFLGIAVLARLIAIEDIGLFGIVLAGVAAIEALTFFTGEQSQIHSARGGERPYLDTVFTVRLLRGLVVGGVLAALAPAFAWWFHKPEFDGRYWLTGLFLALSANGLLEAFQSPARAARMKELDFRRVAFGDFSAALLGTGVQIGLAWWLRDVWALVLGTLAATLLRSLCSYAVAPYTPRLRLEREALRDLTGYTFGAAGTPFLLMLIAQGPALVLGKLFEATVIGVYSYCERLSKIGEDVCLRVLAPVAIPAYAKLKDEPARLAHAWLRSVRTIVLLALPGTAALVWMGNALPAVVFGPEYGAVAWLFPLLAFRGGIAAVNSVIGPLFWAIGEPWRDRRAQLLRTVLLFGLGVPLALAYGAAGFAAAAAIAITAALAVSMRFALQRLQVPGAEVGRALAQAASPGLAMVALLLLVDLVAAPEGLARVGAGCALAAAFVALAAVRGGLVRTGALRRSC
ncbi:MAG: oligosaccharide flippase family protein [Planctomycetota bacterium]